MQATPAEVLAQKMKVLSIDHDYLKFRDQKKIQEVVENGKILFSDKIKKINQNEWTQDRQLVITPTKIFNIHNKKAKRAIMIKDLEGISRNLGGKKPEFTLHIGGEYDYRFNTEK